MENLPLTPPAKNLRHAATVILLREEAGEVQVLMTQRHANLSFMGGMWVFPGGALSDADCSDAAGATLPDTSTITCARLDTLQGTRLDPRECLGLVIAACRETFEETGLLLVRRRDGSSCGVDVITRMQTTRGGVAARDETFAQLLLQEDLQLDATRLIYWAHWITPSSAPRRFDTRFFAIAAPDDQIATPDLSETSAMVWMSPSHLLEQARRGAMPISQPTLYNLEDLNASIRVHQSLSTLFEKESLRNVVPIMPKMFREAGRTTILLPWDEAYPRAPGESSPPFAYPDVLLNLPSRAVVDRA